MSGGILARPQVLHALPGRIRVHLPAWPGGERSQLEQRVRRLLGVRRVEANSLTSNILIGFDPQATDADTLLAVLGTAQSATERGAGFQPAGRSETCPTPHDDRPSPSVAQQRGLASVRQARIAVRGLDRDPRVARKVVARLRQLFGVRARANLLTGRVLVEYDVRRVQLRELLAYVAKVELPDLPGEDRPEHPLDRAPLLHAAIRTMGAALGLGLLAARRLAGVVAPSGRVRAAATAAGVIGLLRSFPFVRNGLRQLLGRHAADVMFSAAGAVTLTFSCNPLGLMVTGVEGLLLLNEVLACRSGWRRYEERLRVDSTTEPGAVIRLKAGERVPWPAQIMQGTGTAIGRDGLPRPVVPGAAVSAGAELCGGSFVLLLQGGKPFLPQPRPAPLVPTLPSRYFQIVDPLALGYAALTALLTRSPIRTLEALLLVNPRPALIGLEMANLDVAARVLRKGVLVVGTRPDRAIRLPDVLLLDGPRVLTDELEITTVLPLEEGLHDTEVMAIAAAVSAAAGSPWGSVFSRTEKAATRGSFNGLWAAATMQGARYTLGPPEDLPAIDEAIALRHRGGYLLVLSREEDWRPLAFVTLRPRLASGVAQLVQTCRRLGVRLEMVPAGSPLAAQSIARRAEAALVSSPDAVAVIRERQQAGAFVAFVSDSAQAAPAFADCDLAIGLMPPATRDFPARADLLVHDLTEVAAVLEAGARRNLAIRDAVGFSLAANVLGVFLGLRGRPGVERASSGVSLAALAALADGWLRLRSHPGSDR